MQKRVLSQAVFMLLLASGASAVPALADPIPATISVVGHASLTRPPDVAIITAEIVSNDSDSAHAQSENDVIVDHVQNALARLGLPDSATHTTGFRSNYVAPIKDAGPHDRTGYVVTRTIEVEVSPSRLDDTTHALMSAGIDSIDDVRTDVRDRDGVYHTLFSQALGDAESQAHIIATAARVKIIRLRSVEVSSIAPQTPGIVFAESRASSIPLQPSQLSTTLNATYEVEPFPLPGYMRKMPNPPSANGAR